MALATCKLGACNGGNLKSLHQHRVTKENWLTISGPLRVGVHRVAAYVNHDLDTGVGWGETANSPGTRKASFRIFHVDAHRIESIHDIKPKLHLESGAQNQRVLRDPHKIQIGAAYPLPGEAM